MVRSYVVHPVCHVSSNKPETFSQLSNSNFPSAGTRISIQIESFSKRLYNAAIQQSPKRILSLLRIVLISFNMNGSEIISIVRLDDKTNEIILKGNFASSLISLIVGKLSREGNRISWKRSSRGRNALVFLGRSIRDLPPVVSIKWRGRGRVVEKYPRGEERTNRPARNKNSPAFSSDAEYPTGIDRAVDFQRKCKFPLDINRTEAKP